MGASPSQASARSVLQNISLGMAQGEHIAIIGPSGAGKTTLLQLLACAQPPLRGSYQLQGVQPWALPRRALQGLRGQIFLAPQVPPLPPRQRVVTAVLAGRLPTWSLAQFGLGEKLFERVDRLSGGERQRVGLARALLSPAKLWLIDEPLSALDPQHAAQAAQTLVAQARERGVGLLASLHHVEMALTYFPRIIGLRQGRIAFDLPATQVTPAMLRARRARQSRPRRALVLRCPCLPKCIAANGARCTCTRARPGLAGPIVLVVDRTVPVMATGRCDRVSTLAVIRAAKHGSHRPFSWRFFSAQAGA